MWFFRLKIQNKILLPSPKFQVFLAVFYPFLCGLRAPNTLGVQWPGLKGGCGEEKALIQYCSIYDSDASGFTNSSGFFLSDSSFQFDFKILKSSPGPRTLVLSVTTFFRFHSLSTIQRSAELALSSSASSSILVWFQDLNISQSQRTLVLFWLKFSSPIFSNPLLKSSKSLLLIIFA